MRVWGGSRSSDVSPGDFNAQILAEDRSLSFTGSLLSSCRAFQDRAVKISSLCLPLPHPPTHAFPHPPKFTFIQSSSLWAEPSGPIWRSLVCTQRPLQVTPGALILASAFLASCSRPSQAALARLSLCKMQMLP